MTKLEGSKRLASRLGVCLALCLSCASMPWPDEPGVPVALGRAENVDAGDSFLSALTASREKRGLSAPLVTPSYQSEMRAFAEDLQSGKTSAAGAQRAIEEWGGTTYHHPVQSWLVDCGQRTPQIPATLGDLPTVVLSYAAAHFRPRSLAADQCVVLVVVPTKAGEDVRFTEPTK